MRRMHPDIVRSGCVPSGEVMAKRQAGIALMLSVLLLFILATIALSSIETTMKDAEVVGAKKTSEASLQMAEAGVADALDFLYNSYDPINTPEIGETIDMVSYGGFGGSFDPQGSYEVEGGSYGLAGGTDMTMASLGEPCLTADPAHHYGVWDIQVQGVSAGNRSVSTIHFSALICQCTDATGGCE